MDLRQRYAFDRPLILLILVVCLFVIAGIWLAALQRITSERGQAVVAAMKSNSNLAIAYEEQISSTLKSAEQVAAFVRAQYLSQGTDIDLRAWLDGGIIREPMFTRISVMDESGAEVASSQPSGPLNYADRDFFQAQRDSTTDTLYISRPVLGRVSGQWRIPMSLRISHPDGRFAGVVVVALNQSYFTDFYQQADLGTHGMLEVTGLDGVVRGRRTGHQSTFDLDAHNLPWFVRQATAPTGHFVDSGEVDGVVRLISYHVLKHYPLMATVGTAYADELAPVLQRRTVYLLVAGSASAGLLLFASLMILTLARQRAVSDALQASETLYRATFHQAAMGIAHISPDGRILRANKKFCTMLGQDRAALLGRTVFDLSDPAWQQEARQFVAQLLSSDTPSPTVEIEKPYRRGDGSILWVCETLGLVKDASGHHDVLVIVSQDITERKTLEARLSHDALHDPLTGLSNRVLFQDRCERALESARRHGVAVAILFLDLDGFKRINDRYGHAVGDLLLQQVAHRLERCVRAESEDTVSRFGGDEFAIILTTLDAPQDCEAIALKILEAMSRPFDPDRIEVGISASIGAALFPQHGHDPATLLAQADAAMYRAKQAGGNSFFLAPSSQEPTATRGDGQTDHQPGRPIESIAGRAAIM